MGNIRRATNDDAAGIAAVHVRTWQVAYRGIVPDEFLDALSVSEREIVWAKALREGSSEVWVAEEDGRVVGWISVGKSRDPDADATTTAELWAIYVHPDSWATGIGRALWEAGRDHFKSTGFGCVTVWILRENQRALNFYRSIGFFEEPGKLKSFKLSGKELVEIRLRCLLGDIKIEGALHSKRTD